MPNMANLGTRYAHATSVDKAAIETLETVLGHTAATSGCKCAYVTDDAVLNRGGNCGEKPLLGWNLHRLPLDTKP
jgi:hypothetical protein